MIRLMENKTLAILYIAQIILFFMCLLLLATDGITQLLIPILGIILFIFGIFNILLMLDSNEKYTWLFGILTSLQCIIYILATKPMFHGIAFWFYVNPWILEAFFISLILGMICWFYYKKIYNRERRTPYYDESKPLLYGCITFIVIVIILLISFFLLASYSDCYLAQTLDISERIDLPDMDPEFLRIVPMKVSDRYATDACQYPRHTPSKPTDITMINGTPYWAYLLVPDGFVNVYNIKPKGSIFIDMTTMDKKLDIKEYEMQIAPDLALTDDIYWKLHEFNYWADCERTMVVLHENEIYLAVPYVEYDLHFTFPIVYRTPKWGGVFLVDKDGHIDDLSPEEARNSPILQGQKLFPEKLVLQYINSQKYWKAKNGDYLGAITNVWFSHDKELEITDVYDQGNSQPFLLGTNEGLKWFVSVEPCGEAHGIYRIYLLDARTSDIEVKHYNTDEIGPVRATNYARTNNPMVDWSQFQVIEPIPVTPGGNLYWEVRIVPEEGSGISYTSFVNPRTGKVVECKTDEQIKQFMKGKIVTDEIENEIIGIVLDIDTYVQNGNTRWIITVNNTDYLAKADELTSDMINIIVDVSIDDTVLIKFDDENNIIDLEMINEK